MRLRDFATPLAGAVFVVMAATGLLMFFEKGTPLGKELHEWLGVAFVVGVVLHVSTNWAPLKAHLGRWPGRVLAVVGAALLVVAVFPAKNDRPPNPSRGITLAVSRTSLKELAPLTRRSVDELVEALRSAGYQATAESSPDSLVGEDREKRALVLGVLFPAGQR